MYGLVCTVGILLLHILKRLAERVEVTHFINIPRILFASINFEFCLTRFTLFTPLTRIIELGGRRDCRHKVGRWDVQDAKG